MRLIDADALEELFREVIGGIAKKPEMNGNLEHMIRASAMVIEMIKDAPTIEPERKKDVIQKFHDYQVEWLTSHCDLELEPILEEWVVRFLHDTANCYMMELDRDEADCGAGMRGEQNG